MKQTIIPAQITTVEDKIAGNLNFTQIFILMIPIFWITVVYILFPPKLNLALYKLPLILIVLLLSLILALRIKGKVVLNWLILILRYNLRPKYYVFNKNDQYLRDIDLPIIEKEISKSFTKETAKEKVKSKRSHFGIKDITALENLIKSQKYSLSFKTSKKGGLNVAFEQVKR